MSLTFKSAHIIRRNFDKIEEIYSPTYGNYKVTRILSINLLDALEDKTLNEVRNIWGQIIDIIGAKMHLVWIKAGPVKPACLIIHNIDVYVPIKSHNEDWIPPTELEGKSLPIGDSIDYYRYALNNLVLNLI